MRYLGIDYGTKKIGLALSDEGGAMAFPHSVVSTREGLDTVLDVIEKEHVVHVVLGSSLNRDGVPNAVDADIKEFARNIGEKTSVEIHFEPEHYSSQEAARIQGKGELNDASAAAILLNSFLSRIK